MGWVQDRGLTSHVAMSQFPSHFVDARGRVLKKPLAVQHGYCSTEYREQGSTRYAELQLVTEHVNQRSLTVGMTRHTDEYGMFYSREAVGSYDDLVALGLRTRSKELASDYRELERTQTRDVQPTRELSVTALRWELEPIARGDESGYSRDERKSAFAILNQLERLEPNERVSVSRDMRQTLANPSELTTKLREPQTRERERAQSLERDDRGRSR